MRFSGCLASALGVSASAAAGLNLQMSEHKKNYQPARAPSRRHKWVAMRRFVGDHYWVHRVARTGRIEEAVFYTQRKEPVIFKYPRRSVVEIIAIDGGNMKTFIALVLATLTSTAFGVQGNQETKESIRKSRLT